MDNKQFDDDIDGAAYDPEDEVSGSVSDISTELTLSHYDDSDEVTDLEPDGRDGKPSPEPTYYSETIQTINPTVEDNDTRSSTATVNHVIPTPTSTRSPMKGRPKRGRKRKHKEKKESKFFINFSCHASCIYRCTQNVTSAQKEEFFKSFYDLDSYEAQCLFICKFVKETEKKRIYQPKGIRNEKKQRQFSRVYMINQSQVCKSTFLNTLQVSSVRVNTAIIKNRKNEFKDMRGKKQGGWNKKPKVTEAIIEHIKKFPTEESHYCRGKSTTKYLAATLTLKKMHELYSSECNPDLRASLSAYRSVFVNNFNLKFKQPRKDTCNICDNQKTGPEHDAHLKSAEDAREKMAKDMQDAKIDSTLECITFDLQKTLPLPKIPTGIIFYKRQIWLYNCGIYSSKAEKGFCYVWTENQAGRGSQEVASCLIKHIKENCGPDVQRLELWSDSCGGQNRNIKMVLALKKLMETSPTIDTINLNFLVSGHSFLPNDRDFAMIEKKVKKTERVYTKEEYTKIMMGAKKKTPLVVVEMEAQNFNSTKMLEKNIVNRKVANGEKISWLTARRILLVKDKPDLILFSPVSTGNEYMAINIAKKGMKGFKKSKFVPLWPNGRKIARPKAEDIKSVMHLIPLAYHKFYVDIINA